MLQILNNTNTILNKFISELKDINIQRDRKRLRGNLERIGEIMAYEISKTLDYDAQNVETLDGAEIALLHRGNIVIATVLRAGLPLHHGFLNFFDDAKSAFVATERGLDQNNNFKCKAKYVSCCDLTDKVLILVDPLLNSGSTLVAAYKALIEKGGSPKHTHIATVIASQKGIKEVEKHTSADKVTLWGYIVDSKYVDLYLFGIGDVGDLAYGDNT